MDLAIGAFTEGRGDQRPVQPHRAKNEIARSARTDVDLPALRLAVPTSRDEGRKLAPKHIFKPMRIGNRHSDRKEVVAAKIERYRVTSTISNPTEPRRDHALVDYRTAEQGNIATVYRNGAAIIHTLRSPAATKGEVTAQKVRIGNIQGGGDERTGVDLRSRADCNTIGVDQEELAVGSESACNPAISTSRHPEQCARIRSGLHDINRVPGSYVKALPVDDCLVARLTNGEAGG